MTRRRKATRLLVLAAILAAACSGDRATPPAGGGAPAEGIAAEGIAAASWVSLDPPGGAGALAPELAVGAGGPLLTWLEPSGPEDGPAQQHRLLLARLEVDAWTAPLEIAAGDDLFANWADRPAMAAEAGGGLVAHWLQKLGQDTYAYGVELARSADGGATWDRLGLLHDDASETEHGFVSWVPAADGVHAFWLDGRAMADEGPMGLRTTLLTAAPAAPSTLLDDRVCECCATDAALTSEGPVVVYRDRGDDEVRDVAIVRRSGVGWTAPRIVHADGWRIHGCPVNGPAVAARGARLAVAWFGVVGEAPEVKVAFSADAGATFGPPVLVDGEGPLGRVDVELDDRGGALVSWLAAGPRQAAGEGAEIRLRHAAPGGELGPHRVIAATTRARRAGVPRMVRDGERLIFAWVEDAKPPRLRAGVLSLARAAGGSRQPER